MLGEADDLGLLPDLEVGERSQLLVLGLLERGIDGPTVRAPFGVAEPNFDPLDHVLGERVAELVGVHVGLCGRVAHEVREQSLDDAVLADDALGALDPGVGQDRLLLLAALDEPFGLEPLQHLAGGGTRDAEHVGDP